MPIEKAPSIRNIIFFLIELNLGKISHLKTLIQTLVLELLRLGEATKREIEESKNNNIFLFIFFFLYIGFPSNNYKYTIH